MNFLIVVRYDWVLGPREGGSFSLWLKATTQHTLELFTEKVKAGSYDSVSIGKHPIWYLTINNPIFLFYQSIIGAN